MKSIVLLCIVYFLISTVFFYVFSINDVSDLTQSWDIALVVIQCVSLIIGGLLAAFVVPAYILFAISISLFAISTIGLQSHLSSPPDGYFWFNMLCQGISFGLFKFIFIVILLDQREDINIGVKVLIWFMVDNLSYAAVYNLFPTRLNNLWESVLGLLIPIISISLLVLGLIFKVYKIDSHVIPPKELKEMFNKRNSVLESERRENELTFLYKAMLILLLLLPYGICYSQNQYAYEYQSKGLRRPNITLYSLKPNYWTSATYCVAVLVTSFSVIVFRHFEWLCIRVFNSGVKARIIAGNMLMIASALTCGYLETYRINYIWQFNGSHYYISPDGIVPKTNNSASPIANLSVFVMIPQVLLLSVSEVLLIPTCIEFMYIHALKSTKYLAIVFVIGAVEIGGSSDLIAMVMNNNGMFETKINEAHNGFAPRLDYLLYFLSFLASISLFISLFFMKRYPMFFKPPLETLKYQELNDH